MAHWLKLNSLPFGLVDVFTICDAFIAPSWVPTDPNRYYMWTGWVGNDGSGGDPVVDNAEAGYGWSTYPDLLQKAGISWKIYQDIGLDLRGRAILGLYRRRLSWQLRRQFAPLFHQYPS